MLRCGDWASTTLLHTPQKMVIVPTDEHNQDLAFMRVALEEAARAPAVGEVPIAAVLVRGDQILAQAHNYRELWQDPTAHAEVIAIRAAATTLRHVAIDRDDALRDRRALRDVYRCDYPSEDSPSRLRGMGSKSRRLRIGARSAVREEAEPPGCRDRRGPRTGESGTHSEVFQGTPGGITSDKTAFNPIRGTRALSARDRTARPSPPPERPPQLPIPRHMKGDEFSICLGVQSPPEPEPLRRLRPLS